MSEAEKIVVITGGRDRTPTLAELERLAEQLQDLGATKVRHGACPTKRNDREELIGSTDMHVAGWLKARRLVEVDPWPADWKRHGRPAGPIRNREMIDGRRPGQLVGEGKASTVISFEGGDGTKDCRLAGYERGIVVLHIYPVAEPRVWNRHHGKPPGPSEYCGWGSPVGNPWRLQDGDDRSSAAEGLLEKYRRWLAARIKPGSPDYDQAIVDWIRALTPEHYVVCSCGPDRCHGDLLVKAWRWLQSSA
jgi:hypothetical protein